MPCSTTPLADRPLATEVGIDRAVEHRDDDLGPSVRDRPHPIEAGQPGYQFARNITLGHGGEPATNSGGRNMRNGAIMG